MNKTWKRARRVFLRVIALLLCVAQCAWAAPVTVQAVRGSPKYTGVDGFPIVLKKGDEIPAGVTIVTGTRDGVDLTLGSRARLLTIGPLSSFRVDDDVKGNIVSIERGEITSSIRRLGQAQPEPLIVRTPQGTTTIPLGDIQINAEQGSHRLLAGRGVTFAPADDSSAAVPIQSERILNVRGPRHEMVTMDSVMSDSFMAQIDRMNAASAEASASIAEALGNGVPKTWQASPEPEPGCHKNHHCGHHHNGCGHNHSPCNHNHDCGHTCGGGGHHGHHCGRCGQQGHNCGSGCNTHNGHDCGRCHHSGHTCNTSCAQGGSNCGHGSHRCGRCGHSGHTCSTTCNNGTHGGHDCGRCGHSGHSCNSNCQQGGSNCGHGGHGCGRCGHSGHSCSSNCAFGSHQGHDCGRCGRTGHSCGSSCNNGGGNAGHGSHGCGRCGYSGHNCSSNCSSGNHHSHDCGRCGRSGHSCNSACDIGGNSGGHGGHDCGRCGRSGHTCNSSCRDYQGGWGRWDDDD